VIDILIKRFGREGIFFSWSPDPNDIELGTEDERRIIADICEQENIHCYYSRLGEEYLDKVVKRAQDADIYVSEKGSIDFRFCLPESVNTFTILKGSSYVKDKGARVMFTGHGGDEGISHRGNIYELFYHHEYYHYWRYLWCKTSKKPRILRTLKKGIKNIASSSKENREPYLNWFASPELLKSDISDKYRGKKYEKFLFDHDTIAYIESGGSRNRLDNMALLGAYTGIRYLIPYLDYRVIDYAVSIPRYLYTNEKSKRYIFREAFKDIMPMSLYKLNIKEDTSFRNMPQNPNWFQEFDRRKKEIVDNLDKEYWSKYLDYSKIEELYKKGEPSDEEYLEQSRQLKALLKCALAKNLLDVSKGRN
jgi:asparagine synthase (glutamine-hydrolysing)